MKMTLVKSMVIVLAFVTSNSFAVVEEPAIEILNVESKMVLFTRNNSEFTSLVVKDYVGEILYSENIKVEGYSKKYDFKGLKNGTYQIELQSDTKIKNISLEINNSGIVFKKESIIFKPMVQLKGDLLSVHKLALHGESLSIKLYGNNFDLLYKTELKGEKNLGMYLSLKKLAKGDYQVEMKSEGRTFYKTISVE